MIQPSRRLADLLDRFAQIGGMIDYVLLPAMTHADAASAFMVRIARTRSLTFDPARAVGTSISEPRFYGRFYDRDTRQLTIMRSGAFGDDEGYAYAFGSPPYGLDETPDEVSGLFNAINDELFGERASLEITLWSTDWSSYFKAGLEWWGAYLWTVRSSARPYLLAIGASTTD